MQVDRELAAAEAGARLDGIRIWVVEDDPEWRGMVVDELEYHGAEVRGIDSVEALYRELAVDRCDILVLDVGLPGEDGLSATGHLRRMDGMGIVLVTGRSGTADMAHGLSVGADVYLPKPLELPVLVAALHSLHRRMSQSAPALAAAGETVAAWSLRSDGWDLQAPNGKVLTLTVAERGFLRELFAAHGEAVERERLIAAVTDQPWDFDPHRLEVLVHRLRTRVRNATGAMLPVRALRGVGYLLASEPAG
ncbi:response regulator transcription factor [Stenotrophomonas acidaminiphila]|uniref:response regulator transcription factor n=1 Tax=Stenotrophomonas TaxID=40323 RepID=UPI001DD55A3B|nr:MULTISPECIES: response regulator transcription factor [Stenotrophomonas]MCH1909834.1 response regulator transcription factor [Stenotrophomonas sp. Y6]MPS36382.1 response regulator transcription factor [Stenotrophomonas sp.]WPU55949.1 response regulator transcription factor [Stenotrophomonas acidaminiphila]